MSTDVVDQAEQAFKNVAAGLVEAGGSIKDVVRVRYILPDRTLFPSIFPVLQKWLGDVRPAATMIQAGLMEEAMLFEVEVTAKKGPGSGAESGVGEVPPA